MNEREWIELTLSALLDGESVPADDLLAVLDDPTAAKTAREFVAATRDAATDADREQVPSAAFYDRMEDFFSDEIIATSVPWWRRVIAIPAPAAAAAAVVMVLAAAWIVARTPDAAVAVVAPTPTRVLALLENGAEHAAGESNAEAKATTTLAMRTDRRTGAHDQANAAIESSQALDP